MPKNPRQLAADAARAAILAAYEQAVVTGALPAGAPGQFDVSEPREKGRGDLASNFAMVWAKPLGLPPHKIAEAVAGELDLSGTVAAAEVAGPGFVNLRLSADWYADTLLAIEQAGDDYGKSEGGRGRKVQVEYVSANPTGPMHLGNARGGVLGDTLSTILEWTGCDVTREFYLNDAGNQVDLLGRTMQARYFELLGDPDRYPMPEDGYHGEDVIENARRYLELYGDKLAEADEGARVAELRDFALEQNIARMKADLARYRIRHDVFFPESSLYETGAVEQTLDRLDKNGALYEQDGALWFAASRYGVEKDDVLRKSNGFYTYYAADIAYHHNKFVTRGFDEVIDIFGADHHGHSIRFKAGMAALGIDPERLRFVLIQFVRLLRDGEVVRMSKRTGKAVSLADLLDEIPVDAARFFFCSRQNDTAMDFDLDLAVKQENDNPVYYVQYAHARICSILRNLAAEGVTPRPADSLDLRLLVAEEERDLIRHLGDFPQQLILAARDLDPSRLTKYVSEAASLFHRFYTACHVRGEQEALMQARLKLCQLTGQVLRNTLGILKVTCPERM
ncbi:MAG: arginine--tRNA ligase [Clostridiales bacterium]|nr:arginine--tRNA ligase [Clostridiales bacterium]